MAPSACPCGVARNSSSSCVEVPPPGQDAKRLPLDLETMDLFEKIKDGVLLWCAPGIPGGPTHTLQHEPCARQAEKRCEAS